MQSILKAPKDLFRQIESILHKRPELLSAGNWHELPSGREAFTEDQILDEDSKHCLAGFIVALTPRGAEFERIRLDVDDYANEILVNSGRKPIPLAIYHDTEESMIRVIRRRAEQERTDELLTVKDYSLS